MRKKILIIACVLLVLTLLAGCATPQEMTLEEAEAALVSDADEMVEVTAVETEVAVDENENEDEGVAPIVEEDNIRYVSNSSSRVGSLDTLEKLEEKAELIITGTCISSRPVFQNETLYTISSIQISEVLRGDYKPGDIILVFEMDGRVTYGEYQKGMNFAAKEFETGDGRLPDDYNLVIGADGFFPLKANEEVLLFLGDSTGFIEEVEEALYGIWYDYDGKLYLQEDGSYARPLPAATDDYKFSEETLHIAVDELNAITK